MAKVAVNLTRPEEKFGRFPRYGELGVIILSGYERDVQLYYATQALTDLGGSAGMGYLFKDRASRSSLISSIQWVAAGRVVVDPLFSQHAAAEYRDQHSATTYCHNIL